MLPLAFAIAKQIATDLLSRTILVDLAFTIAVVAYPLVVEAFPYAAANYVG